MWRKLFILGCYLVLVLATHGQTSHRYYADFTTGGGNGFGTALSAGRLWNLGTRWHLGGGVRLSFYTAANAGYVTAPAILTTGAEGPQVLFLPNKPDNLDSLTFGTAQVVALNLYLHARYRFNERWAVGANIDLVGASWGARQTASYQNRRLSPPAGSVSAVPTALNLLLVSDNDRGTLNSEFYVGYNISSHWAVRGGLAFLFTEYTTDTKLRFGNDRFRNKALLGLVGVTYSW